MHPSFTIRELFMDAINKWGIFYLSSHEQIDDIVSQFTQYYTEIVPSNDEIEPFLKCFGEMMKIGNGRLFFRLNWRQLRQTLENVVSKESTAEFMDNVLLEQQKHTFSETLETFDPRKLLKQYQKFLLKVGYYHMGSIRTGVLLIGDLLLEMNIQ